MTLIRMMMLATLVLALVGVLDAKPPARTDAVPDDTSLTRNTATIPYGGHLWKCVPNQVGGMASFYECRDVGEQKEEECAFPSIEWQTTAIFGIAIALLVGILALLFCKCYDRFLA